MTKQHVLHSYKDIFDQRGKAYDLAMQWFPEARRQEFLTMFDGIDLDKVECILDIPSGGGYLTTYLPPHITVTEIDPAGEFKADADIDVGGLGLTQRFDIAYCLASLHHVHNKAAFLHGLVSCLKPQGFLCLGDVLQGSKEARFLDEFAGTHNNMGHQGMYLVNEAAYLQSLIGGDATLIRHDHLACPWQCASMEDLLLFVRTLFSFKTISDADLQHGIEQYLGIEGGYGSRVSMNFSLLFITAKHGL